MLISELFESYDTFERDAAVAAMADLKRSHAAQLAAQLSSARGGRAESNNTAVYSPTHSPWPSRPGG